MPSWKFSVAFTQRAICTSTANREKHTASNNSFLRSEDMYPHTQQNLSISSVCATNLEPQLILDCCYCPSHTQTIIADKKKRSAHLEINRVPQKLNFYTHVRYHHFHGKYQPERKKHTKTVNVQGPRHWLAIAIKHFLPRAKRRNPITLSRHCISPVLCHMTCLLLQPPFKFPRSRNPTSRAKLLHGKTR